MKWVTRIVHLILPSPDFDADLRPDWEKRLDACTDLGDAAFRQVLKDRLADPAVPETFRVGMALQFQVFNAAARAENHRRIARNGALALVGTIAGFYALSRLRAETLEAVLAIVKASPWLAATALLISGLFLFWFRLHARATYGLVEVVFGIVVGTSDFQKKLPAHLDDAHLPLAVYALCIGAFFIVRGLDNLHTGIFDEKKRDRVLASFNAVAEEKKRVVDFMAAYPKKQNAGKPVPATPDPDILSRSVGTDSEREPRG